MADIEVKEGNGVRLIFEASRCIHSRNCVLSRPDVFVPNVVGEWLHPEKASPGEIAELAHACPSGAIRYERTDGEAQETPPMVNTIRVRENGPLAIHATITIGDADEHTRATLCRCGASANKPYCDGSHNQAEFQASGEPATRESQPLAIRGGPLTIKPAPNGPLLVSGPVELITGTGRTFLKTENTALCRCGHSANKPFCDGSHAKAGFRSEA
jgi:CDGSH-type Zn-finger protein/uncharacterized Fe-S cluster protein YjdI